MCCPLSPFEERPMTKLLAATLGRILTLNEQCHNFISWVLAPLRRPFLISFEASLPALFIGSLAKNRSVFHPSVHLPVRPPTHPSIRPPVRPSVRPSLLACLRASAHPSISLSIHLPVRPSAHPPVRPSVRPPGRPPVGPIGPIQPIGLIGPFRLQYCINNRSSI